jgi:VanZ family protein
MQDASKTTGRERSNMLALARQFFPIPFLAATVAYCLFLFSLSSMSSFPVQMSFGLPDKAVHFCLYGGLSAAVGVGLHRARRRYSSIILLVVPVGFSGAYGLSDEIHQLFVNARTFETGDIVADTAGAAVAALLLLAVFRRRNEGPKA